MKNYYYFVTSLPDISLESEKLPFTVSDYLEAVSEEVDREDLQLLKDLLYHFDNRNLIKLLTKNEDQAWEELGIFSKDELEEEIKTPLNLPKYMIEFIEGYKKEQREFPKLSLEDELTTFYFNYLCTSSNQFIRNFVQFDFNLRNVLTALNCRKFDYEREKFVLELNDESGNLVSSTAGDFSLSRVFDWLHEVLTSFQELNTLEFEQTIDALRFSFVEEQLQFDYFTINNIIGYYIKLSLLNRWLNLTHEKGDEVFTNTVNKLAEDKKVFAKFEE